MPLTVGDRTVRPLTADEVLRMVELGILGEDEPVELLHGVLTAVTPKSPDHEAVKASLLRWLAGGIAEGRYEVRVEAALAVADRTSLPEPDLMVLAGPPGPARHPGTALLVVEVAVSSLRTDTTIKPALYAAAGVPELWVIEVPTRRVRVLRDPLSDGYATEELVGPGGVVQPQHVDVGPLVLSEAFAGV